MVWPPFSLFDILPPLGLISVVDVGALPLNESQEVYTPLVQAGRARVTGFEPAEGACANLTARMGPPHRFLPHIIGDGSRRTFHITTATMCSSLYPPNTAFVEKYSGLAELMAVKTTEEVQTVRLDDVIDEPVDFLKLDVQGAELDVLKGAPELLKNVLLIHTEVKFAPLYVGQPLFADVDQHLRAAGFQLHSFPGTAGRPMKPVNDLGPGIPFRQQLWADAVYMRDIMTLEKLASPQLMILAALMHDLYAAVDLVAHIIALLQSRGVAVSVESYFARVNQRNN